MYYLEKLHLKLIIVVLCSNYRGEFMLSNKWVFTLLLILSITVLTLINNYYFYAHVARENERGAERIQILINNTLELCKENQINSSNCNKQLIETIHDVSKYYYYTTETVIKDATGKTLWEKERNEHDKVSVLNIEVLLPDLDTSTTATFNIVHKWSNSNIALSVFRSMTFSITQLIEIYNNNGLVKTWDFFTSVAWYRSRPTIGFTIFTFILLWLYRNREKDQIKAEEEKDEILKDTFKKNTLLEAEKTKLTEEKEQIEAKFNKIYTKLQKYDYIINPPINTLNFSDLISMDTSGIGNKFRKTLEKLLLPIFQSQFNYKAKNLSEATKKLVEKNILSQKVQNYADIIRIYGNMDSHYNEQDNISKDEIIALANYIILIVEEIAQKDLFPVHINHQPEKKATVGSSTKYPSIKTQPKIKN